MPLGSSFTYFSFLHATYSKYEHFFEERFYRTHLIFEKVKTTPYAVKQRLQTKMMDGKSSTCDSALLKTHFMKQFR
jgi:hypothetical protein